jgi:hypothetical protein
MTWLYMTAIYGIAAVAALLSAGEAYGEFVRDRMPALVGWVVAMAALGASLALAAADPAVLRGGSGPAASACSGFGILGTWTFAEVLSIGQGNARRVTSIMATPLLGSTWATLVLIGLHWIGSHGILNAEAVVAGTQLTLLGYYTPCLCQVAFLAWQRASLTPPSWSRTAMRAVCASACEVLVLTMARSALVMVGTSGTRDGGLAITVIAVLQGIAVIWGIGALAVGPAVIWLSARCRKAHVMNIRACLRANGRSALGNKPDGQPSQDVGC